MKVAHTSTTSTEPAQVNATLDDRSDADRAAFAAASYVRPQRPTELTARPLASELADQGWEQAA